MNIQTRTTSHDSLFYAGLGTAAGAATVLAILGLWRIYAGDLLAPQAQAVWGALTEQASVMGLPLTSGSKAYWYSARAGGMVAYLLLWVGTLWGVLMSGRLTKGQWAFGLHEFLPTLAIIFSSIHAVVLLGDAYIGFSVMHLLVPFASSYRPLWTGLGTLALYLGMALIASFYLKRLVSRKLWRTLHYLSYAVFGLALLHGIMAGTDSGQPMVRWMYVLTAASLLFATLVRILTIQPRKQADRPTHLSPARSSVATPMGQPVSNARGTNRPAQQAGGEAVL